MGDLDVTSEGEPRLGLARFRAAVGTPFTIPFDDASSVTVTLVAVEEQPAPAGWERFSLVFEGPTPALPQWTYSVEHDTIGTFSLFLGPVAGDAAGVTYEAVFNRQAPAGAD